MTTEFSPKDSAIYTATENCLFDNESQSLIVIALQSQETFEMRNFNTQQNTDCKSSSLLSLGVLRVNVVVIVAVIVSIISVGAGG